MSDVPAPPPGYVAYGGQDAVDRRMQRIGRWSLALIVLIAVYAPLSLANLVDTVRNTDHARQLLRGDITIGAFRDDYGSNVVALISQSLVLPIALVTFVWMFKIAQNVRALGRDGLRFAPGWALGGWFTPPCVLYVVPWLMFRELWKASDPQADRESWRTVKVSPIVDVWWVLYGLVPIAQIFSNSGLIAVARTEDTDEAARKLAVQLDSHYALNLTLGIAVTLAAAAYLLLVMRLSARHRVATREM
ncbi:MAG: DUF4328 domain-containing protein [Ilumatobacteraceae bacterium]